MRGSSGRRNLYNVTMQQENHLTRLDATDWRLIDALQRDGRTTVAALARIVNLGTTATSERLARLLTSGVISGIHAVVDPARVGLPLTAFVRMRPYPGSSKVALRDIEQIREVMECHHVTGEDCYLMRVCARDMEHLERVTERLAGHGQTTTSLVFASPVPRRSLVAPDPASGAG